MAYSSSGLVGGDTGSAAVAQASILDQEKGELQGNPQFADAVANIDRERRRLPDAPPSPNASKLVQLAGGSAGAAPSMPAPPSDNAAKLVKLASAPLADTSDPEGNKDARDILADPMHQRQVDIANAQPGWLTRLKATNPGLGQFAGAVAKPLTVPPQQDVATMRGAVTGGLGAVGNLEDFGSNTVPNFGRRLVGMQERPPEKTFFPTSADVSGVLDKAGWKANPAWQDYEKNADTGAGLILPGAGGTGAARAGDEALQSGVDYLREGGKAGETLKAVGKDLSERAKPFAEVAGEPMGPAVPGREAVTRGMPGTSKVTGVASAPMKESADFESLVNQNNARLSQAKQATRAKLESTLDAAPKPDMTAVKEELEHDIALAGSDKQENALRALLNRINKNETESPNAFRSMDDLRRQINDAAKPGEDVTGYASIGANNMRKYSDLFKQAMVQAHKPYGDYLSQYSKLSKESEPALSKFLSSVGEKEGGGDLVQMALRTPKNVDATIAATGGNAKAFDAMATKRIVRELEGKDTATINRWAADNVQVLEKLPGAKAAVQRMQQTSERVDAIEGIAGKLQGQGRLDKAQAQAAAKAYELPLTALQHAPAGKQGPVLEQLAKQMRQDNLLSASEYEATVAQIKSAQASANRAAKLGTLAKYITYMATNNYLVSFGGHAFIDAAKTLGK